jgi:uncharacterized protein YhhL (DUF1145 family)
LAIGSYSYRSEAAQTPKSQWVKSQTFIFGIWDLLTWDFLKFELGR